MKQIALVCIFIAAWSCNKQTDTGDSNAVVTELSGKNTSLTEAEIKQADSVNIDFQFMGNCYAYSSAENAVASNGEAHSDNLPNKVDKSFPEKGFYLVINQKELSIIGNNLLSCKLYLVNTTNGAIELEASDSRLYIVAEALNDQNEWVAISYLPVSDCGNSYHTVTLDEDEYWSFDVPVFKGPVKTKLRYTLTIDEKNKISSNEITAYLNKGQFDSENKERHSGVHIMDPY